MKKFLGVLIFCLPALFASATSYLIFTTNLDGELPDNNLSSAPLVRDHDYYIYLIQDMPFNTNSVYFELSVYREKLHKYVPITIFRVPVDPTHGYCYQATNFNIPMKVHIRAYTDSLTLATKEVELVPFKGTEAEVKLLENIHPPKPEQPNPAPVLPSLQYPLLPSLPQIPRTQ